MVRDEKQEEIAELWIESDRKNTLIVGTGVGKSKITMLILSKLFELNDLNSDSCILLLTNSEILRDTNWKEDFEKWNLSWMWDKVVSECYQTVYKWKDTKWDLVISDEIDFCMTEVYSTFFLNNECSMILGLTGFVDPSKDQLLNSIAPSIVEYSTQDAQEDGILNKTQLVLVEFDLSMNPKDITVKYKSDGRDKTFTQSENDAYAYIEDKCNILYGKISRLEIQPDVIWGLDSTKVKELKDLKYQYNRATAERKKLLYTGIASRNVAKQLQEKILSNKDSKVICFSMLTDQADSINTFTYHGKNSKGSTALKDLDSGTIRALGVCKAVNRGANIIGLNNMIQESYDGSKTQFIQRHGRGTRLEANQTMYLFVMLPYYHKKVNSPEDKTKKVYVRRATQAVKWAENMMSEFTFNNPMRIKM